jgi:hypothetical protein
MSQFRQPPVLHPCTTDNPNFDHYASLHGSIAIKQAPLLHNFRRFPICNQLGTAKYSGRGVCLPEVHIYNGDGGVDAAHEGGRSRFTPLEVADVSVKVPCMRILGEFAIHLVNEALDFGHRSKPPVVFRLFLANVEAVTQADSHAVSR